MEDESWPPAPNKAKQPEMAVPAKPPNPAIWKRYGFLLGLCSNLAVTASCVRFFFLPYGSGLDFEGWLFYFVMPLSLFVVVVGSVLCLWGMGRQRDRGGSITLDMIGLALSWLPFPLAMILLQEAFAMRRLWDDG